MTAQPLDPAAALAYSCNSYFTTVALRLTPAQLRDSFARDGFASVTRWRRTKLRAMSRWRDSPEQLQLQAIGEWGISVTPLELVHAYRNVALLQPKHDAKLAPLFAGLQQSVAYGMGHEAQPAAAMKVAGKTGTAPADEGPWTHAWFAGYAPAENPEIVLVVFLEKGHGGSDAAAVAREIFAAFANQQNKPRAAQTSRSSTMKRLPAVGLLLVGWMTDGGAARERCHLESRLRTPAFRKPFACACGICIRRMSCAYAPMPVRRKCANVRPAKIRLYRRLPCTRRVHRSTTRPFTRHRSCASAAAIR